MQQSFVWTCLPNGLSADGNDVLVSVLLTPRLDPGAEEPALGSFKEWLDWPAALDSASFEFFAAGVSVATRSVSSHRPGSADHGSKPDSEVWKALFHRKLPVNPYQPDKTLLESEVLSYSASDIHGLVRELYQDLATRSGEALPRIGSDLLSNASWSELVQAVAHVDRWGSVEDVPGAQRFFSLKAGPGATAIQRRFAGLPLLVPTPAGSIGTGLKAKAAHLARFELFHTPPLKPIPVTPPNGAPPSAETIQFERPDLPKSEELARQLDFERLVAAMNGYPTLQRRLGLVFDFAIERKALPPISDFSLRVKATFRAGALTTPLGATTQAITHAVHSDDGFFAASKKAPGSTRVERGLLDLYSRPGQYEVLQADVDGAGLKLMNFARTLAGYERTRQKEPAALTDEVSRHEKQAGAPALRTAGLMLVQNERALALKDRLQANEDQMDAAATNSVELYAEDLTRGYRVDVWDSSVRVWRSLCRRTAQYLLRKQKLLVSPASGEEEGTVELAATRAPDPLYNPNLLNLHEAVLSWTGWSLAAPPPGLGIGKDRDVARGGKPELSSEAELPPGLDFRSRFKPVPGSLPRLRYGRRYDLRARAVDLAGNSLPPQDANFGPERPDFSARPFSRFEPLLAPILALARPLGGVTQKPAEGESMARLAIRSLNDDFDDATPSDEVARRYAVPPQSSAREAELHGMLDAGGVLNAKIFAMLAHDKDLDAHDPAAALVEERIPLHGPLDVVPVDTTFAVWKEGGELGHLPDPLAENATACFINHPTLAFEESLFIPLYTPGGRWPDAQPFRIELFEDAKAKPAFDIAGRVLRVPLAKGERATLRLSMRIEKTHLKEKMGLWGWLDAATRKRLEGQVVDGRHWMFTPFQDIELVHAVQRPLLRPEIEDLRVDRAFGDTFARPHFHALCSLKSSDRLDVHGAWHEPVDDPSSTAPSDRPQRALPFHVKITEARDHTASADALHDHGPPQLGRPNRIEVNAEADQMHQKNHEFNDTRYRRIEYQLRATTRYREYLPGKLPLEIDGKVETLPVDERHLTLEGGPAVTWVPNSANPVAPQVLYVVPTFGWTRTRADDGTLRSWRRGGGLRVYLGRPWNVSGYGEMLAVLLPSGGFKDDPDNEAALAPYKNCITHWGSDPIWESQPVIGLAPQLSNFPLARFAPDPSGSWLPPDAPTTEADQAPVPFTVKARTLPGRADSVRVDVAPHDVFFDDERQLWYSDIEIDMGRSYWPFVRLALARYQPSSVEGAHLSDVVLADVMQLTAHRWLTVRPEKAGRVRNVTVYGFGYEDSAGAQELREAGPKAQGTPVASTSVVDVFLEQLDPTLGEDFGWHRIATGTRGRPIVAAAGSKAGEALKFSPEQRIEAARLLKARNYASALSRGVVEELFVTPQLWDGKVTLPAPSDGVRLRIGVEEYEEYPIDRESDPADGIDPNSPVRTRTGRRLVFAEHVELS